jgi:hypothetical protein
MLARLIIWILFGVILSLAPLLIVAITIWQPNSGSSGLLEAVATEELLAVAFTLSGAAAVDALVNSGRRAPGLIVGGITLLLTFFTVAAYVLIKIHATHLSPEDTIFWVQRFYLSTVIMSFFCECIP